MTSKKNTHEQKSNQAWLSADSENRLIRAVFFFSGACCLTYQISWTKIFSQVIGIDTVSWAITIGVFLFGMAAGAASAERLLRSPFHPLKCFLIAELFLGAYGMGSAWLLRPSTQTILGLLSPLPLGHWADAIAQVAILIPPTLCMGSALPLLVANFQGHSSLAQSTAGWYRLSTWGGACGVGVAGFWAIGTFGISKTLFFSGLLQISLGLVAWAVLRPSLDRPPSTRSPLPSFSIDELAIFIIGFVVLSFEILLMRVEGYFLSSTSYVHYVVLAIFLGYSAAGAGAVLWGSWRLWEAILGALLATCVLFVTPPILRTLFGPFGFRLEQLAMASDTNFWSWVLGLGFALATMVPVFFLSGLFSLWLKYREQSSTQNAPKLARLLSFQALGNVTGVAATAFLLIPQLGTIGTFRFNASLLAGLCLFLEQSWQRRTFVLTVWLTVFYFVDPTFYQKYPTAYGKPPDAHSETKDGSVFIYQRRSERSSARIGAEAITLIDRSDRWRDSFPVNVIAALRSGNATTSALQIGLGGGDPLIALKQYYPQISVHIVELLPAIVDEVRLYGSPLAQRYLAESTVQIGDGRRYLNAASLKNAPLFDVIQIGVLHVTAAGAGNISTVEALRSARTLLKPGGVLYLAAYPSIVRAALEVFEGAVVVTEKNGGFSYGIFTQEPLPSWNDFHRNYGSGLLSFAPASRFSNRYFAYYGAAVIRPMLKSIQMQSDDLPTSEFFLNQTALLEGAKYKTAVRGTLWPQTEKALFLDLN